MRLTLFDYGAGNLHSIAKALVAAGGEVVITADAMALALAEVIVLPGVGAFGPAAVRLAPAIPAIRSAISTGTPVLGICLGMQLLFERSEEAEGEGLAVFKGAVTRLASPRVPHLGWNSLEDACDPLLVQAPLPAAYFAHSFACRASEPTDVTAWSTLQGERFPAIVRHGRVLGVQFHPEKSSRAGISFLAAYLTQVDSCA